MAAMTAHKVSSWENRCVGINTSSDILSARRRRHSALLRPREVWRGSAREKVASSGAETRSHLFDDCIRSAERGQTTEEEEMFKPEREKVTTSR